MIVYQLQERLVSFREMVVSFTQKEWHQLNPAQRAIYHDVMLGSVGYRGTRPDMNLRQEQEEGFVRQCAKAATVLERVLERVLAS